MPRFRDISEWYTPERVMAEEVAWALTPDFHKKVATFVKSAIERHGVKTVGEMGCGSGIVASMLPETILYAGIDANVWFVDRAKRRNAGVPGRIFSPGDVRTDGWPGEVIPLDLVMCWSFLKHFGLDEWDDILGKVLRWGKRAAFDVQIRPAGVLDNGTEFHHVFVTRRKLEEAVAAAGHEIEAEEVLNEYRLETGEEAYTLAVLTRRKEEGTSRMSGRLEVPETEEIPPGELRSKKPMQQLIVNGLVASDFDNYSLRWYRVDGGVRAPVLYYCGKRVTSAWSLVMDVPSLEEVEGRSANTA